MSKKENVLLGKLDTVLSYLCNEFEKGNIGHQHSKDICQKAGLNVVPSEAYLILDKLNFDFYLDVSNTNQWMFCINYNGIVFNAKGGYTKQIKDLKIERLKKKLHNAIVIIGIIIGAIFSVYKIFQSNL